MHRKNTVKYNFYTVFLVTFVVNATWLDIILLNITPLKKTVTNYVQKRRTISSKCYMFEH